VQIDQPPDTSEVLIACAIGAVAAAIAGALVTRVLTRVARKAGLDIPWSGLQKSPIVLLFVALTVNIIIQSVDPPPDWADNVSSALDVALIVIVGWLALVAAQVIEEGMLSRYPATSIADRRSRHTRTKISLLRKIADATIITIIVGMVLWTIPAFREIGVGIIASAGVVGIVAGLAAQTTLSNVIAGIQIAFTDAIRIDDTVEVEGWWGQISDITLTYVVVRAVDGSSLIFPCTYFVTTPFRNSTHQGTAVSGRVEIGADWQIDLEDMRAELARVLGASPNWDGRQGDLRVEDSSGPVLRLVAVVSAADGDALAALRWEVREALVGYVQREQKSALPPVPPTARPAT
jgi:small-conductance mechanosensitive channel